MRDLARNLFLRIESRNSRQIFGTSNLSPYYPSESVRKSIVKIIIISLIYNIDRKCLNDFALADLDHDQGNSCRPVIEPGDISAGYLERLVRGSRQWLECRIKATGRGCQRGISWRCREGGEGRDYEEGGCSLSPPHSRVVFR
ncbi:hypothetical protein ALC53_06917 [Atta colombica]|uniref:Uncharacterized protein n=1 Tax=Atta colombica TaxID=520822 RepID=A0A195BEY0_9HYME|nr:hypothetical protein ALC53_06917 [Atta colombica]